MFLHAGTGVAHTLEPYQSPRRFIMVLQLHGRGGASYDRP